MSNPFNINLIGKRVVIKKEFMILSDLDPEKRVFNCCSGRGCYPNKIGRDILGIDYDAYIDLKASRPEIIMDQILKRTFNFRFESHHIEKVIGANTMTFLKAKSYSKLDNILWYIFSILREIFYYPFALSIFHQSRKTTDSITRFLERLDNKIKKTFKTIFM